MTSKKTKSRKFQYLVRLCLAMAVLGGFTFSVSAYDTENPTKYDVAREKKKLEDVGIDKKVQGSSIDLGVKLWDEEGGEAALKDYFLDGKPALVSVVYYQCPGLCNFHMNGLVKALEDVDLKPGEDYKWIAVSMDTSETPELAKNKKQTYVEQEGSKYEEGPEALNKGWSFLTGSDENVKKITQDLGFTYRWDEEGQQFAHASAVYVLTPEGKVSNIISGIEFTPQTLRLTLVDAAKGQIGSIIDKISLFCFQFNPQKNKYTVYAYNFMKIGALLTLILVLIFLGPYWYKTIKKERQS